MSDNELLLAISGIVSQQIEPLKKQLDHMEESMKEGFNRIDLILENELRPDIRLLAENYVPSAKRYETEAEKINMLESKVELLEKVVTEHSEKLQKIS